MIWVIAGTLDGRQLALALAEASHEKVFVSVVSTYGAQLAAHEGIEVYTGRLPKEAMMELIKEKNISILIDGSHPYAQVVTETAIEAAHEMNIPYYRFEREEAPLPEAEGVYPVANEQEAAQLAAKLCKDKHKRIFLTTGSKTQGVFKEEPTLEGYEIWTRVLPTQSVIADCEKWGYSPKYIVAMQGPFSYDMNKSHFKDTGADVVIMKNSGLIGGADTKYEAALSLGCDIVLINRPKTPDHITVFHHIEDVKKELKDRYGLC